MPSTDYKELVKKLNCNLVSISEKDISVCLDSIPTILIRVTDEGVYLTGIYVEISSFKTVERWVRANSLETELLMILEKYRYEEI